MAAIWILLIVFGSIWAFLEFCHLIFILFDEPDHDNWTLAGFILESIKEIIKDKKEEAKDKAKKKEDKKLEGMIQIVEQKDKNEDSYFIAQKGYLGYYEDLIWYKLCQAKGQNNPYWHEYESCVQFNTIEEAQDAANEVEERQNKYQKMKNYKKVVGEFRIK